MIRNYWVLFSTIALILGIRDALAGEAWLMITSDLPGAAISIDNTYRGITPQHSEDALWVKVAEGIRQIRASKKIDGKDYAAQQDIEVIANKEIPVRFNLYEQMSSPAVTTTPYLHSDSPEIGRTLPLGEMEVPGKNF